MTEPTYKETEGERALRQRCDDLERRLMSIEKATGLFATKAEISGPKGDPVVRLDPKDWRGERCKGRKMSECPAEFLDEYAKTLAYFAEHPKEGKEKYAAYDKLDAARARTWARVVRSRKASGHAADESDSQEAPGAFGMPAPSLPEFAPPAFDPPSFEAPRASQAFIDAEFEPADDDWADQ